ncbi:hypothetical protein J1N35_037562 [Gossypium stocksii]|uniref:C2 domain-containing protein n=1 Tax=Gossypium stocksii TaxID=47602 RepID=A0A9D3UKG2_9ROSI|nr:hypothetical protein J1N35_037562 [Gossypium stocksii]
MLNTGILCAVMLDTKDAHEESKAVTKAPAMKYGGKPPIFQEKFTFSLLEGLTEVNVVVWNINTLSSDDLIGYGRVQLQKALSQGYDDSSWAIQTGRMHMRNQKQ